MRGYFGVGMEGISKPMNFGAIARTANAFGASFLFTVAAHPRIRDVVNADTSRAHLSVPTYAWDQIEDLILPHGCRLVGVELTDDAIDLPSFRHPTHAAYVFGRERGSLSPEAEARCAFVVKIPTRFCLNVGLAAALVMYDRMICLGGFPDRPVRAGGPSLPAVEGWVPPKLARR